MKKNNLAEDGGDMTVITVARLAATSPQTIKREIKNGHLDAYLLGNQYRITLAAWDAYREQRKASRLKGVK